MIENNILFEAFQYPSKMDNISFKRIRLFLICVSPYITVMTVFKYNVVCFLVLINNNTTIFNYLAAHSLNVIFVFMHEERFLVDCKRQVIEEILFYNIIALFSLGYVLVALLNFWRSV